MSFTGVENGLSDEVSHDFSDWGVVLSTAVEDIFDDFVELIHLLLYLSCNYYQSKASILLQIKKGKQKEEKMKKLTSSCKEN